MESGQFAYRKNLENARKELARRQTLDQGSTKYKADTASETAAKVGQGLMRPRARPETPAFDDITEGMGMTLFESFADRADEEMNTSRALTEGKERGAPSTSPRPLPRAGSVTATEMEDRELLALTLQAEAGGEGMVGMLAAGSVIRNRADSGKYGKGIRGVIMRPGQFSAWNLETKYASGKGGIDMGRLRATKEAYAAADKLLSGDYEDKTGGATHYYNDKVATPDWGQTAGGNWTRIGNHLFGFGDGKPGSN